MANVDSPSAPLAGATVLVTRPAGHGATFARRARALGAATVPLPGLSLRPPADADAARAALRAAAAFDGAIFVSPVAVARAFALLPALHVPAAFGVGAGTVRALARHGLRGHAPRERADSEGLLALADFADVRGHRYALVGAPGGRDLIAPTLRARGAEVVPIHVYERAPPRLTRRHFDALAQAAAPLLLPLSSAEALGHLVALLPPPLLERLRTQPVVASSARLAELARTHGFTDVTEAASALTADLLAAAARALARHRL
jgi:uroporphyrinogen-III synthase